MATTKKKRGRPKKQIDAADDSGSKSRIFDVALRLFATEGYSGVTVQDIAKEAGANLSLISYHFGGKENLYFACVAKAAESGMESARRLLTEPKSLEEFKVRVQLFIEEIIEFHVENPYVAAIMQREASKPRESIKPIFEVSMVGIYRTFENYLIAAQKSGFLKSQVNLKYFGIFYFNSIIMICKPDSCAGIVLGKSIADPKYRKGIIETAINDVFAGVLVK